MHGPHGEKVMLPARNSLKYQNPLSKTSELTQKKRGDNS